MTANGTFAKTQPSDPVQTCTVHNGSGVMDKADVSNIIVSCSQAGRFAYVANQLSNDLSAYAIDADGALTPIAGSPVAATGTAPASLAVDPNGRFTPGGGALAVSGASVAAGTFPIGFVLDPSGQFAYAANDNSGDISGYAVDATTGALSPISHSPFAAGSEPRAIAID